MSGAWFSGTLCPHIPSCHFSNIRDIKLGGNRKRLLGFPMHWGVPTGMALAYGISAALIPGLFQRVDRGMARENCV